MKALLTRILTDIWDDWGELLTLLIGFVIVLGLFRLICTWF